MDLKSYSKVLTDIYLIANTPQYLYENMRRSPVVSDYIAKRDTGDLIKEFNIRASTSISDVSEIAEIYAIMIALSFKSDRESKSFFEYVVNNIKFEWFSKIAEYYLTGQLSTQSSVYSSIPVPSNQTDVPAEHSYNAIP